MVNLPGTYNCLSMMTEEARLKLIVEAIWTSVGVGIQENHSHCREQARS